MSPSSLLQVKAAAGSGKTYTLTDRFLRLLDGADESSAGEDDGGIHPVCRSTGAKGYGWPEILAVTFTNKAASEMKERVVTALKLGALADAASGEYSGGQRARWSPGKAAAMLGGILHGYHRLNIRTIDSLLNLLLRLFALDFGISPDFEVVFDESQILDPVYDRYIAECEAEGGLRAERFEQAVARMLEHEDKRGFNLAQTVRDRLAQLLPVLEECDGDVLTDPEALADLLRPAYDRFRGQAETLQEHIRNEKLKPNANLTKFLDKCLEAELFDGPKSSKMIEKDGLDDGLNKSSATPSKDARSAYLQFQRAHADYQHDQAILGGAYAMAPTAAIAAGLLEALREYEREHGLLLGGGLARHVSRMLGGEYGVPDAFCRLGGRLHHLLVDEFQDTGRDQWRAMTPIAEECLAKGGSLFYVGDVKQAIYGWRGGDAALFDEVMTQTGLAEIAEEHRPETLPNNWRSARHVVEFNNAFFGRLGDPDRAEELAESLLPGAPDEYTRALAAAVADGFADARQDVPDRNANTAGYVRITRLPGGSAEEIANQTLDELEDAVREVARRRPLRDLAVLVRSNTQAGLVCDRLVEAGFPVVTESSLRLQRHPIVRQLAALLRLLDYPLDDGAVCEFLAGREVFLAESGLDETTVLDWLATPGEGTRLRRFGRDFPCQWRRLIEPFHRKAGLMTPYDLTREAVRVYRVLERHPDAELYVTRFLEVVHLAEEKGLGSLAAFLEFWEESGGEERVPLPESLDAVRIMTIHKSKGLEFPVVFVPFHKWDIRPDRKPAVVELHGHRLLTPLTKALGDPYWTHLAAQAREQLNLLYVAWTRPREELYGFYPGDFRGSAAPACACIADLLELSEDEPVAVFGTVPDTPREDAHLPAEEKAASEPHALPPCPDEPERLMAWLPRLRVYRHSLDDISLDEKLRGEVIHKGLELLRIGKTDESGFIDVLQDAAQSADSAGFKNAAIQDAASRAAALALHQFPAIPEAETLRADIAAACSWVLGHPELRRYAAEGRAEPEILDEEGQVHRADLVWFGPEETVVVEYKTGRANPEYALQVRRYLRLLAALPESGTGRSTRLRGLIVYLDRRLIEPVEFAEAGD